MECTVLILVLRIVRKVAVTLWMERVLDVLMDIPDERVNKVISLDSKSYIYKTRPNQKRAYIGLFFAIFSELSRILL